MDEVSEILDGLGEWCDHMNEMFGYRPEAHPKDLSPEQMLAIYRDNHPEKQPIIPIVIPQSVQ